jgi:hypothetical protein
MSNPQNLERRQGGKWFKKGRSYWLFVIGGRGEGDARRRYGRARER